MHPSEYSYDYLEKTVVPLIDNYIYRISDSMKLSVSHKINKEILENDKYDGTILRKVLTKRNNKDNKNDELIYTTMDEHIKEKNIELFDETHLVVHLRLGDIVEQFVQASGNIREQINKKCKEHPEIKSIVIVTALHYGHPSQKNKFYNSGTYSYNEGSHKRNINALLEFIKKLDKPVLIQSSDIDIDFCKMVFTKHLITTKGGFSKLVGQLNEIHLKN